MEMPVNGVDRPVCYFSDAASEADCGTKFVSSANITFYEETCAELSLAWSSAVVTPLALAASCTNGSASTYSTLTSYAPSCCAGGAYYEGSACNEGPSSLCFVNSKFTPNAVVLSTTCDESWRNWNYRLQGLTAEEACSDGAFAANMSLFSSTCCSDNVSVCAAFEVAPAVKAGAASVVVSFNLAANAPPTQDNEQALKLRIATELGVPLLSLIDFTVAYTTTSSRRHQRQRQRRRALLTATYTWTASFTVQQPASDGSASDQAFANNVVASLSAPSFVSAVATDVGATIDMASVTNVVVDTPAPSMVPPSSPNSPTPAGIAAAVKSSGKNSPGFSGLMTTTAMVAGGGALVALALIGAMVYCLCCRTKKALQAAGPADEVFVADFAHEKDRESRRMAPSMDRPPSSSANKLGRYEVTFAESNLGFGINAPRKKGGLPTVRALTGRSKPNNGDVVESVNGELLAMSKDPHSRAVDLIRSSGRPVRISFARNTSVVSLDL